MQRASWLLQRLRPRFSFVVLALLLVYRVYLCLQAPIETSDLYRHLGYGFQLRSTGFAIYETTPADFAPEFWTRFWTNTPYIYPPATICFFGLFAGLGVGLFWVKLALTGADIVSAWLVRREFGMAGALMLLGAPVTLWFTSHEGQYESLVNVCIMAALVCGLRRRWFASGFFGVLGVQFKPVAVLVAPVLLRQLYRENREDRIRAWTRALVGGASAIVPFVGFYLHSPGLLLRPFRMQSLIYNPFHWDITTTRRFAWEPAWLAMWDSGFTYLMLITVGIYVWTHRPALVGGISCASFFAALKSLSWAQFWYTIITPAFILGMRPARRWLWVLMALYTLHEGRAVAQLVGIRFGVGERVTTVRRFEECRLRCDYSAIP